MLKNEIEKKKPLEKKGKNMSQPFKHVVWIMNLR
jgi:hypothetical protein